MAIQQDQLPPLDTSVTFEEINNVKADRIIHNGSDIIKCEFHDRATNDGEDPRIIYFQTDGDKATAFTMEEDYIVDLSYDSFNDKYYTIRGVLNDITESDDVTTPTGVNGNLLDPFNAPPAPSLSIRGFNARRWTQFTTSPQSLTNHLSVSNGFITLHRSLGTLAHYQGTVFNSRPGSPLPSGIESGYSIDEDQDTLITLDYDMPLGDVVGAELAGITLSLASDDPTSRNLIYQVGAVSNDQSTSRHYRIALSGTEDTSSFSSTRFKAVRINGILLIDLFTNAVTGGSGSYTISGGYNGSIWTITSPPHALSPSGTTFAHASGTMTTFVNDFITFQVESPSATATSGEGVAFTVYYEAEQDPGVSGTLDISRSGVGGGVFVYSSSLSNNYDFTYGIFDFFANDAMVPEITGYSEQFGLDAAYADNFTVTSGSISGTGATRFSTNNVSTELEHWILNLEEVDEEGQVVQTIVNRLNILPSGTSFEEFTLSGATQLAVNEGTKAYVKVFEDVYTITLNPAIYTPTSTYWDEVTSTGIQATSGIIPEDNSLSFSYNDTSGEFLQYVFFDGNTDEVRVKTLEIPGGVVPSLSDRQLFLDIPDWEEHAASGVPYNLFLHGTDHTTLFYLRRHGNTGQNTIKSSGSNGVFNGNTFTSSTANFITDNVQVGDVIILETFGTRRVDQVVNLTTLILTGSSVSNTTGLDFSIASNAEFKQFNTDPSLSAFAAVNVDDFSLRAGTSDSTTVRAEVINAWGDPLNGKNVDFSVTQGDGAVSPASDTTDITGEATTTYTVGPTPGPVQITAVISD